MKAAAFSQPVVLVHSRAVNSLKVQPQVIEEKNRFIMHTHLLWQSLKKISLRLSLEIILHIVLNT